MISREHITLEDGDFELLVTGPEGAPLVLCLHGFPDVPSSFEPLLEALAGSGYRAVAPWLRGYAPSTREGPFHPERIAEDVLALASALSPDRPAFLVGHDWGSLAVQRALARWPDRFAGAVLMALPAVGAFLRNAPKHPAQLRRSYYIFLFQLPAPIVDRIVRRGDFALIDRLWRAWSPSYRAPEAHMRALKGCLAESMPAPVLYYSSALRPLGRAASWMRELAAGEGRIRVPTLSLMGSEDGCIGPEMAEGEERFFEGPFRREVIPGVGHFMQLERPDAIARRVIEWFELLRPTEAHGRGQ